MRIFFGRYLYMIFGFALSNFSIRLSRFPFEFKTNATNQYLFCILPTKKNLLIVNKIKSKRFHSFPACSTKFFSYTADAAFNVNTENKDKYFSFDEHENSKKKRFGRNIDKHNKHLHGARSDIYRCLL